jgi:hypothetical protein
MLSASLSGISILNSYNRNLASSLLSLVEKIIGYYATAMKHDYINTRKGEGKNKLLQWPSQPQQCQDYPTQDLW